MTRDGEWNKSAAIERRVIHEYGLAYSIRLSLPAAIRAAAVAHAKVRFHRMGGRHLDAAAVRPTRTASSVKWLRQVHVTCKDHTKDFTHKLYLPECLLSTHSVTTRVIQGEWMLAQWADFWKERRIEMVYDAVLGFGLRATAEMRRGTRVAMGVREPDINDPSALVEPCGTLYGPASLANAACVDCANIVYAEADPDCWHGVASRTIHRGDAVCASYTPNGVREARCAVCGSQL